MKTIERGKVLGNRPIASQVFRMDIEVSEACEKPEPGQFINIYLQNGKNLLPRSISVMDCSDNIISIVYQVVGEGTKEISSWKVNEAIKIMLPLGNGFPIKEESKKYALLGGGMGIAPMYFLAKHLKGDLTVFLGYRSELPLYEDFQKLGASLHISTDDGNAGFYGNVVDLLKSIPNEYDMAYICGPKVMMHRAADYLNEKAVETWVSMEEKMACGIGACFGCTCKINAGKQEAMKKICSDGPIFNSKEVVWL